MKRPGLGPAMLGAYAALVLAGDVLPLGGVATKVVALAFVLDALRGPRRAVPRPLKWAAAFAVLAGTSMAWSIDPEATRRVGRHLLQEGVLLGAVAVHRDREDVLTGAALGACLGAAVLGIGLAAVSLSPDPLRGVRISVGEGEPGIQGRAAALGILLGTAPFTGRLGARPGRNIERLVLVGIVFAALGVGLTGSRGAWLAAGLGILAAVALGPTICVRRMAVTASVVMLLGIGALELRPDTRAPLPGVSDGDVEAITSGRDAIWRNAATLVGDHPLVGVGAGAVPAAYEVPRRALEDAGGPTSKPHRDAHSLYLEVAASLGPLGLLLLLLALGDALRGAVRQPPAAPALLFAVASGATLTTWEHTGWWLAFGFAVVATQPASSRTAAMSSASTTSGS